MNAAYQAMLVGSLVLGISAVACGERTPSRSVKPPEEKTESQGKTPMRKLRILCLHGYQGSAGALRGQARALTTGLESLAEFVYVDAPLPSGGGFRWWRAVDLDEGKERGDQDIRSRPKHYEGWSSTRDWIVSLFQQQRFDGVFGFSQGAALAGLLVGLRAPDGKPTADKPLSFDFAIMVSGFRSRDPSHAGLYASRESYSLPSLHLIGRADALVSTDDSRALASAFQHPTIIEHDGGHVIASTPEVRAAVASFLEERLKEQGSPLAPAAAPSVTASGPPIEVPLWRGGATSSMKVVFPEAASAKPRPAMIVFQGGAYGTNAGSGGGAAEWAASHGMVGILVRYGTRATQRFYPGNYADAARAVRLVRRRAAEWGIDSARVGVMGFSAGGHLASLLSTQPTLWKDPEDDLAEQVSARPDLVVLAYPLISFIDGYRPGAFVGSVENFFGRSDASEEERRRFSSELHVDAQHPPVFVWTTKDDALVPYTHAQKFAEACERAHVPVAFKLYPHGPHGMGLALDQTGDVKEWTSLLLQWLSERWGPLP
jgi:acetyl esterase/lipase